MNRNKRRKRNRLPYYDYSQNGYYFVTICVKNHSDWLGQIRNGEMELSNFGKIANACWLKIPKHFPNIELDEYIIMPNHVHGIIIINRPVGNAYMRSLHGHNRTKMLIPKIIHEFKSAVTRHVNKMQKSIHFQWQKSYYDHIIRNHQSLYDTRQYIRNNPSKWECDRNNPKNL